MIFVLKRGESETTRSVCVGEGSLWRVVEGGERGGGKVWQEWSGCVAWLRGCGR